MRRTLVGLVTTLAVLLGGTASAAPRPWIRLHPSEVRIAKYVLVGQWRSWPWPEPYRLVRVVTLQGSRAEALVAALDHLQTDPYKVPEYGCPPSPSPIYRVTVVYWLLNRVTLATDGCVAIGQPTILGKLVSGHRIDGRVWNLLGGRR